MFKEIKIVPYDEKYDKVYITLVNDNILENFKRHTALLKDGFPEDIYQIAFNDAALSMLVVTHKNKFAIVTALLEEMSRSTKPNREEVKQALKDQFLKSQQERKERNMDIFLDALLDKLEKKQAK